MTLGSLSRLTGASPKWCRNALAHLGLGGSYDLPTARRLALTHLLHNELGIPLRKASTRATQLLSGSAESEDGIAAIRVDLPRFEALWIARLAALRDHPPRSRGRPIGASRPAPHRAIARALTHGLDISALRVGLARTSRQRLIDLDGAQRLVSALRR